MLHCKAATIARARQADLQSPIAGTVSFKSFKICLPDERREEPLSSVREAAAAFGSGSQESTARVILERIRDLHVAAGVSILLWPAWLAILLRSAPASGALEM